VRTSNRRPPTGAFRTVERWAVGVAMSIVAFVLERVVMRAVKDEGGTPSRTRHDPTTFRSKGGAVDLDD
jgi:hypothetical protein